MDTKGNTHIIFGLGQSGLSCARYFDRIGQTYSLLDTRENPPGKNDVQGLKYCRAFYFGAIEETILDNCQQLVVSPGIALNTPLVQQAIKLGIDVCGDVEIFSRACKKPIIAITGSNGKSTVTDLTDKLIQAAGIKSQKCGNIGLPVLDFLPEDSAELYVLELSSFQLDTTDSLKPKVAVLLNLSEDHMDRYPGFEQYCQSKHKIFQRATHIIFNQDDELTYPQKISENDLAFSLKVPSDNKLSQTSYINRSDSNHDFTGYDLIVKRQNIVSSNLLNITGKHNYANALASLNILSCLDIEIDETILVALQSYGGLEHRFQLVLRVDNCEWINDSKATNVGATIAALNSVEVTQNTQLILIAGGDSKQSELSPLIRPLEDKVSEMVLLGKDAKLLSQLTPKVTSYLVDDMHQAVCKAKELIKNKAVVLLSPACSSLDMFKSFEARGEEFIAAVRACA